MMNTPKIVSIEGNIGCGKTTLIDNLEIYLQKSNINNIRVLREPIHIWTDLIDSNDKESILTKFYKDKQKFAFSFQVLVLKTILEGIIQCIEKFPDCELIICERSNLSSRFVFTKMLYDDAFMNEIEYKIYESLFDNWVNSSIFTPQKLIFLNVSTETSISRIIKRNRTSEYSISEDYINSCRIYHQLWLHSFPEQMILTINCNQDIIYDLEDETNLGLIWINQILSHVNLP
jgi:deoxyadenosine/deoxycytidine kinase